MADLDAVLEQLKQERKRAEGELKQLGKVIEQLSKARTGTSRAFSRSGKRRKPQLSARQLESASRQRKECAGRRCARSPRNRHEDVTIYEVNTLNEAGEVSGR